MEGRSSSGDNDNNNGASSPSPPEEHHTLYEQLVRRLYKTNLFHPVRLGLQNIERLHEALGSPMDNPNITIVHIAGTNGKGSTALKIARTLELSNTQHTVGLFVSPHVSSFRERMSINGTLITEHQVEQLLPQIYTICEQNDIPATFFEITTALAFLYFATNNVDVIVLETGLGGRLDATNVITKPALCVITSIGLEHTRILGDTIELIGREKGGIMKEGCPVLVGPNCPQEVMRQCGEERKVSDYFTVEDVLGGASPDEQSPSVQEEGLGETTKTIVHDYDAENARIATAAIRLLERQKIGSDDNKWDIPLTDEQIRLGTSIRPPCRFEHVTNNIPGKPTNATVVLDVAHNPDAIQHLLSKLQITYPNKTKRIVVGFSSDKDLTLCGTLILNSTDATRIHLVQASHPRAATLEAILEATPQLLQSNYDTKDRSITRQVQTALTMAEEHNEILVICGSVFIMSEAREALGFEEPRDTQYIAEVAGANLRHGQENFGNTTVVDLTLKDDDGKKKKGTNNVV